MERRRAIVDTVNVYIRRHVRPQKRAGLLRALVGNRVRNDSSDALLGSGFGRRCYSHLSFAFAS